MNLPDGLVYLLFAAISLLSASAGFVLTGYVQRAVLPGRRDSSLHDPSDTGDGGSVPGIAEPRSYEFRDGYLVSEVGADDAFIDPGTDRARAFVALTGSLATLHPDLPARMKAFACRGEAFFVIGYLGPDALAVAGRAVQDRLVVTVTPADDAGGRRTVDAQSFDAVEQEASDLRQALALSAAVQWKETEDGRVVWANPPYLQLAEQVTDNDADLLGWPLPQVFGGQLQPRPSEGSLRRCHVLVPGREEPFWFDVAAAELSGGMVLFSARPIDRLVQAEAALRDFVQTLSKTFATLPIGLAVFDRKRELVLFNPALVTISMLEPGDLSRRPTLRSFLDQLRERQRMPEPRDYRAWRDEIARLEQGAAEGTYHELWTLPGGESLRVTGRPHPDGAIAFMFENISKEISVTRRFRADLDLDRAILDDTAAALVVFDREGKILRTNAAYDAMWDGPDCATLIDASRRWQAAFEPTGLWGDIRQFAAHEVDRAAWAETVTAPDGTAVQCRVAPLSGGHTIVWFLSAGGALDDPMAGWLPRHAPTRADLDREAQPEAVAAEGGGAA